jgi:hypothetical protein
VACKRMKGYNWVSYFNHGYYDEVFYSSTAAICLYYIRIGKPYGRLPRSSSDIDTLSVIIRLLEEAGSLKFTIMCAGVCWSFVGIFLFARCHL